MALTINPSFNTQVKSRKTDGDYKTVNIPYMVTTKVGGVNYLTVTLSNFPDKDGKCLTYCEFTIKKDLSLVFNFSYVANKKGYVTKKFNDFANLSEIVFKHFENLTVNYDDSHGKSNLVYDQSYMLLLPLLNQFSDTLNGSLDSGFNRKLGTIDQTLLVNEWSKFTNSSDPVLNTVANAMALSKVTTVSEPIKPVTEITQTSQSVTPNNRNRSTV